MTRILIEKSKRLLTMWQDGKTALRCPAALGGHPTGHKRLEGDGRTPEGVYYICLKRETGKYGCALGISYPSLRDARRAAEDGRLDGALLPLFAEAERERKRPPWGTPLGGEIYIHGGGAQSDWTAGCVALEQKNMAELFALCHEGDTVEIIP